MSAKSGREVAIRATSGLVYVALVLGLILVKAPYFQFGMAFFSILLARESFFLVKKWSGNQPSLWVSPMFLLLPLSSILPPNFLPFDPALGISAALLLLLSILWLSKKFKSTVLWLNLGILIQVAFWLLSRLGYHDPFPSKVIMVLFFLTWIQRYLGLSGWEFFWSNKNCPIYFSFKIC